MLCGYSGSFFAFLMQFDRALPFFFLHFLSAAARLPVGPGGGVTPPPPPPSGGGVEFAAKVAVTEVAALSVT